MSTLNDFTRLTWSEIVPDRPFTNPDHNAEDLATLQFMAGKLRDFLSQLETVPAQPCPFVVYLQEADGRQQRIAISNFEALLTGQDLTVVGFCGQKWPEADRTPLDAVDEELIAEFLEHPYLLSYSSLQLKCGNWCNLVLFSQLQGLGHWARSLKHAYAASELAPNYYQSIRLHNGVLPGGVMSGNELTLLRTKYYDYQGETIWWAVRELLD